MLSILASTLLCAQVQFAPTDIDHRALLAKMGVSELGFTRMRDEVSSWVYWDRELDQLDDAARDWQDRLNRVSSRLRLISDTYCERQQIPTSSRLLRQWLFSTAVCAYVCSNLDYDFDVVNKPIAVRNREAETDRVFSQTRIGRKTMCVGFVLLARDLIRKGGDGLGISAQFVGSFYRQLGGTATELANHAVLGLRFDGELLIPADLTTARLSRKEFMRRSTAPRFDYVLPFTQEERELVAARNYGADETLPGDRNHGDEQNNFPISKMTLAQWKVSRTDGLSSLDKDATRRFDSRAKWLEVPGG